MIKVGRTLHSNQAKIWHDDHRFRVVVAGRRFGKTILALSELLRNASDHNGSMNWYIAPTYRQAKQIAWQMLFNIVPGEVIVKKNEFELTVYLINGSEISLRGADNPDSLRGVGLSFAVLDEYGDMRESVWTEVVRPMLVDSGGRALFIGTPKGFNHFYDIYNKEKEDKDFKSFHFTTRDNKADIGVDIDEEVDKAEKEAVSELEKIRFNQEYLAKFEVLTDIPYFDINALKAQERHKPIGTYDIFNIWEYPEDDNYIIGADPAEGLERGDNTSVFVVNRRTLEVAAEFTGKLPPDVLGQKLKIIGEYYNTAFIGVEVNNHGLTVLTVLKDIYNNIYYRQVYDEIGKRWTRKLGWHTNTKTRPLMLDNLARLIRERLVFIKSEFGINELMTFTVVDGKPIAQEGCLDDRVFALSICYQMINEVGVNENQRKVPEKIKAGTVAAFQQEIEDEKNDWRTKWRQYGNK